MLKDAGYQEKFEMLHPWHSEILETVKKDLKNEHLKIDREFCKRYFLGKNPNHVTLEEMVKAYRTDVAEGNVSLGEFIASRWLLKNTDIYGYFEEKLRKINPDFENIETLPEEAAQHLVQESVRQYGSSKTYLFCVFNSVVLPASIYSKLKEKAEKESQEQRQKNEEIQTAESLDALQKRYAREIAALTDKYEKKLSGLQKKYLNDTEMLKKQVSTLQKKLHAANG